MITTRTPEQAARTFSTKALEDGYIPQALHAYTDAQNHILYWRIRLKHPNGHKWIRPMHKDENNQYQLSEPTKLRNQLKQLYGLHLLNQNTQAIIFIVEGEYPADVLNKFFKEKRENQSYIAVTSGSATSAASADWKPLATRHCIIWPDFDEAGIKYAEEIFSQLENHNCKLEILDIKNLNLLASDDCVDWIKANPTASISDIITLPRLPKEKEINTDEIISRLAALTPVEYDRARIPEAKLLNIRPGTLDNLVKATRAIQQKENKTPFAEIEPWHETINPTELLTEIASTIKRFIVCQPETVIAATLWIAMTWFIDAIQIAPLAVITAPEKRCGKSQLLFLLARLVNRPLAASNISSAALFRSIDAWQPTLLIDEADAFIRENEELRGLLNCGHTRESAYTVRVVGDDHTPKAFFVWGAKALAGIGHLADTIMDRSITLELRRKLAHEKTERLRHAEPDLFRILSRKLSRFSQDYAEHVRIAKPELPDTLNDRAQDNWEPLLAIADIAGGEWPRLARLAAIKLSGDTEQAQSIGVELLKDIQEIFENKFTDRIASADLIKALCDDEEKPWATYNRGFPIKPRQVAGRLREFGIISNTIRVNMTTAKGYLKTQFIDAFARYIPSTSVTTSQAYVDQAC